MTTTSPDTVSLWREEGSRLIPENFKFFRTLLAQAKALVEREKYEEAAVCGEMAASFACGQPCGFFVSFELEHILLKIGKQAIKSHSYQKQNLLAAKSNRPKNILHVCTSVMSIGGHSRMLWRWIFVYVLQIFFIIFFSLFVSHSLPLSHPLGLCSIKSLST